MKLIDLINEDAFYYNAINKVFKGSSKKSSDQIYQALVKATNKFIIKRYQNFITEIDNEYSTIKFKNGSIEIFWGDPSLFGTSEYEMQVELFGPNKNHLKVFYTRRGKNSENKEGWTFDGKTLKWFNPIQAAEYLIKLAISSNEFKTILGKNKKIIELTFDELIYFLKSIKYEKKDIHSYSGGSHYTVYNENTDSYIWNISKLYRKFGKDIVQKLINDNKKEMSKVFWSRISTHKILNISFKGNNLIMNVMTTTSLD